MKNSLLQYSPVARQFNLESVIARTWWTFLVLCCPFLLLSAAHAEDEGTSSYVWALQGINLRENPSATARVITKLNYGVPVSVLSQDEKAAPYEMRFFPKMNSPSGDAVVQAILSGAWIKVRANDQQGYVFNKLLLTYPSIKKNESVPEYFARIFNLTAASGVKKNNKNDTEETSFTSAGARKVQMKTLLYVQSSGSEGDIFVPDMSFDEAFVLVNAIFPPQLESGYTYHKGASFQYQLRDAGAAKLIAEKGGVRINWAFEP